MPAMWQPDGMNPGVGNPPCVARQSTRRAWFGLPIVESEYRCWAFNAELLEPTVALVAR